METFVIATSADRRRIGLTYKVELPARSAEEWYTSCVTNRYRQQGSWVSAEEIAKLGVQPAPKNTTITWFKESGAVEFDAFAMTWQEIQRILVYADNIRMENLRPGRPEKHVLQMTTSKERRLKTVVPLESAY